MATQMGAGGGTGKSWHTGSHWEGAQRWIVGFPQEVSSWNLKLQHLFSAYSKQCPGQGQLWFWVGNWQLAIFFFIKDRWMGLWLARGHGYYTFAQEECSCFEPCQGLSTRHWQVVAGKGKAWLEKTIAKGGREPGVRGPKFMERQRQSLRGWS